MYYQQGDVLVKSAAKIPAKAVKQSHLILAAGETTGHKHQIVSGKAFLMLLGTAMYLRVIEEAKLLHEEHKALVLPPGDYQIDKVREYDHFLEESRNVRD